MYYIIRTFKNKSPTTLTASDFKGSNFMGRLLTLEEALVAVKKLSLTEVGYQYMILKPELIEQYGN